MADTGDDEDKPKKRPNDQIRHLKNWDQVEKIYIDLDSPNFKSACSNLGIDPKDCRRKQLKHFKEKGQEDDVIQL